MMSSVFVLSACAAVTLALRVLPLIIRTRTQVQNIDTARHTDSSQDPPLLDVLPLALLSALIVPGTITVDPSNVRVGLSATAMATALAATRRVPLAWVISASVAAAIAAHYITKGVS